MTIQDFWIYTQTAEIVSGDESVMPAWCKNGQHVLFEGRLHVIECAPKKEYEHLHEVIIENCETHHCHFENWDNLTPCTPDGRELLPEPKVGSREWYREKLTGEWERETMYFEYFDVHHDSCVEVHKPTHDGTPTGDRWQTDITVWGDPTHDGTPRKEDAEPCVTFRTIDDLCKHLETLHVATMQLEDLTIESRNRLELERCTDRPTAWAADCTADDFEKLTSRYEVSDEDCDIVGRRFRFKPDDGLFNLSVFVADYAGNEAHALIYVLDEFMGTVMANVLPIDKLRGILTEARGWQRAA